MHYRYAELGLVDYSESWDRMRSFVEQRTPQTLDEIWYIQHSPVFTLGRNGARDNILEPSDIPVIHVDRGGDVTYHGPGQVILYILFDLRRLNIKVKGLVYLLEQAVIDFLQANAVEGTRLMNAPGIYVENKKIASLGLRVRNGYSYHGVAVNVDMDLHPFQQIHPCGLKHMQVTQLRDHAIDLSCNAVATRIADQIAMHCELERL